MEKMMMEILKEIKDMRTEINDINKKINRMETKMESLKSGQDELFTIQKTILERSQFYGALKERVDLVAAKNDTFQYEIYRDYVRKEKLVHLLEEMKKAL